MEIPKTYRANAGWTLSLGSLITLLSGGRWTVISLCIVGVGGGLWSAYEHGLICKRKLSRTIPIIVGIVFLFATIGWWKWPITSLHDMSNDDLKISEQKLSVEMIDFEKKREADIESFYTTKYRIQREPDLEKRVKLDKDIEEKWIEDRRNFESEYRKNYLNRASEVRDELLRRLRMSPEQSEKAVEANLPSTSQFLGTPILGGPIDRALAGNLGGPHPIAEAAMYLDGLTRLLQ